MADPARILTIALFAAGLAWATHETLRDNRPLPPAGTASDAELPQLTLPEQQVPALESLQATLERPLFNPERRPPAPATQAESEPSPAMTPSAPPALTVSAIIVEGSDRSALLTAPGGEQPQRVREGTLVSGWRLIEIHDDSILLQSGTRHLPLPLHTFATPPPPPAPPRPVPPRPDSTPNSPPMGTAPLVNGYRPTSEPEAGTPSPPPGSAIRNGQNE